MSYAVGHAKLCIDRHIMCNDVDPTWAMAQSCHLGLYVRQLEELDKYMHNTLALTGRHDASPVYKDDLTSFFAALNSQILAKVDSMPCVKAARKLRKKIIVIVPTSWSDNLRQLVLQVRFSPTLFYPCFQFVDGNTLIRLLRLQVSTTSQMLPWSQIWNFWKPLYFTYCPFL